MDTDAVGPAAKGYDMEEREQQRQEVERLMRRASGLGHDPQRVARALSHPPLPPTEPQAVVEVQQRQWLGVRVARRLTRRA